VPGDQGPRHSGTAAKRSCQRLLEGGPLSEQCFLLEKTDRGGSGTVIITAASVKGPAFMLGVAVLSPRFRIKWPAAVVSHF